MCALLLVSGALLHAQSWADPTTWSKTPAPKAKKNIVYFPSSAQGYSPSSQVLDVYENSALASGEKAPVLVFIHGGAWSMGQRPANSDSFLPWLAAGFSVVNIEYRLLAKTTNYAPAAVQDVGCALAWVKQNADQYHFDLDRVVTSGRSAGGHLALLAAVLPKDNDIALPQCRDQVPVAAVLDYYGLYDLEPTPTYHSPAAERWIGPNPKPSLAAMEHKMSPSSYIRPGIPPVFRAHGEADPWVPYQEAVNLKRDMDKVGVRCVLHTVAGGGHGGWKPEENQSVDLDSLRFLQSVGIIK
jgi:acetyl esterase/lipase